MFIDPTPTVTRDMVPLQRIVERIQDLPIEHVLKLAAGYVDLQRSAYPTTATVIERRLAAAEDDEERLVFMLWAGLWIGEIRAFVLHPTSNRAFLMTRSAWDPTLNSLRDLSESILDGVFLGPKKGTSLETELIGKPILIPKAAQRHLTRLKPASNKEIADNAKRLVAEHKARAAGPMLRDDFVWAILERLPGRVSRQRAKDQGWKFAPRS